MNKVICDICGTTYHESNDQCPICGSSREYAQENTDFIPGPMPEYIPEGRNKAGTGSGTVRNDSAFYDSREQESDAPNDVFPEEACISDGRRVNVLLVISLSLLCLLMLFGIGFLFFRYYLPNVILSNESLPAAVETEPSDTVETITEIPTVPCESLILTAGVPEITRLGQYWLLHVIVLPENTTDTLSFFSTDESIVTVTAEGRLCAVGEGETTVIVSCGQQEILCPVSVCLATQPSVEATETSSEASVEVDMNPDNTNNQQETGMPSETQQNIESQAESAPTNGEDAILLKLKQSDLSFSKKGVTFQLEMDCPLSVKDVEWYTMNSNVAICHDGLITVLGSGTTKIVAKYGNQEVYCIVRCNLK